MKLLKKKSTRKMIDWTATSLIIVGAINWGLIGIPALFGMNGYNIVEMILGSFPIVLNLVYSLVGISAVYILLRNSNFMN